MWRCAQGHAFAILDVVEEDGHQLLKLYNPWGKGEWTGAWSDKSDKWTRRLKNKLGWEDQVSAGCDALWLSFVLHSFSCERLCSSRLHRYTGGRQVLDGL